MALFMARIPRRGVLCATFALVGLSLVAAAFAQPQTPTSAPQDADPLRQAERSVVRVITVSLDETGQPIGVDTGSGFVVAPGKVVTNRHVVLGQAQASAIDVFVIPERDVGGASEPAAVAQTWNDADLALLSAPNLPSPPIAIAKQTPGKDATVHALGYPGVTDTVRDLPLAEILSPQEPYVTPGSIALYSSVAPGGKRIDSIFHTAPINPGNSGGPLIDECGRVIGVNTWGAGAQLAADGEVNAPQGQFVASRASVLAQFLADAQVAAQLVDGPCVPAAAQTLDNRLSADETAIASQKDQLARLALQLQQSSSDLRELSILVAALSIALVLLLATLVLIRVWPRERRVNPAPASVPPAAVTTAGETPPA